MVCLSAKCRRDARDPLVSPAFQGSQASCLRSFFRKRLKIRCSKLFALEFSFTFACLAFGRQALTLLNR
ncbi:MAG: hypothetical protein LBP59_11310 [Planctomycetaceae bacterium]|nr:hypothetical protein [Planctomycetaceae bacterium]